MVMQSPARKIKFRCILGFVSAILYALCLIMPTDKGLFGGVWLLFLGWFGVLTGKSISWLANPLYFMALGQTLDGEYKSAFRWAFIALLLMLFHFAELPELGGGTPHLGFYFWLASDVVLLFACEISRRIPDEDKRKSMTNKNLVNIAEAYRLLIFGIAITFVTAVIYIKSSPDVDAQFLKFSIITIPIGFYCVWAMTRAMRAAWTMTMIYFILALIPMINFMALVSLNMRGRKLLKSSGIEVGIFGVRSADLPPT